MRWRGSYTVEMAFLMPLILGILYGVICFSFLLYDKAVLHGMAYEGVITGEHPAERVLLLAAGQNLQAGQEGELIRICHEVQVRVPVLRLAGAGADPYQIRVLMEEKVLDPVGYIRNGRLARKVWEGVRSP